MEEVRPLTVGSKISSLAPEKNVAFLGRFWAKVNKAGPVVAYVGTPCWIWTGSKIKHGYGNLRIGAHADLAHRVSYVLAKGDSIGQLDVMHRCDVGSCVNPEHLVLGTARENIADMDAKGRRNAATGDRHASRTHPELIARGERQACAKLTESIVVEMREAYARGDFTATELAAKHGVSVAAACYAIKRKTWRHVP